MNTLTGKHLVNGAWIATENGFTSHNPATNTKNETSFFHGNVDLVDQAAKAAADCAEAFATLPIKARADFIRTIAEEIDARGDAITEIGQAETALPAARLEGERGRTVGQLRFFADWIEEGSWLGARIDTALPDRAPLPRPDIRVSNKALGPVAVFGASNFPLAFSTAGGDTASALAAGCPVIVKAHPAHPGTTELVAQAIDAAIKKCDLPAGVFSMIQGGDQSVGQAIVKHPAIKAVGFTGSLAGGRALFDIAVSRPDPIPFYGELGSNNPVFLMPSIMSEKADAIAEGWAGSLTMGVGQFCTNPGIIIGLKGAELDSFKTKALSILKEITPQAMLTDRIAAAYANTTKALAGDSRLTCLLPTQDTDNPFCATPAIFEIDYAGWKANPDLSEEIFGPAAFIVECDNLEQMEELSANLIGQLTTTIQMNEDDTQAARNLIPHLERNSGRVLVNGFPTGVEVCHAMVHGGPYPASTDSRSTSVGSKAIERFVRPVCYQNMPDDLLPEALKNTNPLGIQRLIDGVWGTNAL
ncbi:aldehyde dehydrogenase (NADP(+)) [Curvivirga sp.]|uniref:aldehyde dehydrogenase (NADP(+)) n=1 Tax=Curvivirga sp. TaxID=2856848 RepID=UPI003B5B4E38